MTLDEARRLLPNAPLFAKEISPDPDHPGGEIVHHVNCTFFKMLGEHVVIKVYGNLYLTLTPEELFKP